MVLYPQAIIITADKKKAKASTVVREQLKKDLNKVGLVGIRPVAGCYKGEKEDSYIGLVPAGKTFDSFEKSIQAIARKYNQETALYLDSNRAAYLLHAETGEVQRIGQFTAVSAGVAIEKGSYTYTSGTYYAVI